MLWRKFRIASYVNLSKIKICRINVILKKDVGYIQHLSDRKNVSVTAANKSFPFGTVRETCRCVVIFIGKTALGVLQECGTSVSRISLIELRGGRSVSACHFTCKLKHLTPARKQRDNYVYVTPSVIMQGYLGDCFGKAYWTYPGVYLSVETTHRRVQYRPSRYPRSW